MDSNKSTYERYVDSSPEAKRGLRQEQLILDVTESLLEVLIDKGWSRQQLADAMGSSKSSVSRVLNGSRNMTLRTLSDIALALECKVNFEVVPVVLNEMRIRPDSMILPFPEDVRFSFRETQPSPVGEGDAA